MGWDGHKGSSMYPKPVTDGRYQGLVGCLMGSQGTIGQWDVPKSQWTFYSKPQLRKFCAANILKTKEHNRRKIIILLSIIRNLVTNILGSFVSAYPYLPN